VDPILAIVCVVGILGLVLVLSRGKTTSNWYKHENHRTSGVDSHDAPDSSSPDMSSPHVVDIRTKVNDAKRKRG